MKRFLLLISGTLLACSVFAQARFEPRTTWPYLYDNFMSGAVRTNNGVLVSEGTYNICVVDGTLHYIADDKIMQADMGAIFTAKLGEDIFVKVRGAMYQVLAESEHGSVLLGKEVNMEEFGKVDVGYGVSVSSSAQHSLSMTVLELDGNFNILNESLSVVTGNKMRGKLLPLRETTYIYTKNRLVKASRSEIQSLPGIDRKALSAFAKKEKIRWTNTDSLLKVLEFIDGSKSE